MKRRPFLGLLAATPACSVSRSGKARVVQAGPFSVHIPAAAGRALVEHVPMHPLYTPEGWKRVNDPKDGLMYSMKPGYSNRPENWAIRFPKLARKGETYNAKEANDDPTAPQILIHRYRDWPKAYTDGIAQPGGDYKARDVAEELRELETSVDQNTRFACLAYMDAAFMFASLKRKLSFQGGEGVRYVGEWTNEPTLPSNDGFHYVFNGFTKDGSTHVLATFPLHLADLPDDSPGATHLGRSLKNYEDLSKNFETYEKEARAWLEAREAEIQPSLAMLDGMIESLTGTWA